MIKKFNELFGKIVDKILDALALTIIFVENKKIEIRWECINPCINEYELVGVLMRNFPEYLPAGKYSGNIKNIDLSSKSVTISAPLMKGMFYISNSNGSKNTMYTFVQDFTPLWKLYYDAINKLSNLVSNL